MRALVADSVEVTMMLVVPITSEEGGIRFSPFAPSVHLGMPEEPAGALLQPCNNNETFIT